MYEDERSAIRREYNKIAKQFSQTRNKPWPEFEYFAKYLKGGEKILDLGCGNGRLGKFLKTYKVQYTGLDFSEKLIDEAKKNCPNETFVVAEMTELPFEDESFDQVWTIASFHHLPSPELRKKCLKEIKRVLKKGGICIIITWNLLQAKFAGLFLNNIKNRLLGRAKSIYDFSIPWKNSDGKVLANRYYHAFTPKKLHNLLKKKGFKVLEEFCSLRGVKTKFLKSCNLCMICQKP